VFTPAIIFVSGTNELMIAASSIAFGEPLLREGLTISGSSANSGTGRGDGSSDRESFFQDDDDYLRAHQ